MRAWPDIPVEDLCSEAFEPPHCPWPACPQHLAGGETPFAFRKVGTYARKLDGRSVQRYRCASCCRTFSQQTFSCTYYLKRPALLPVVFAQLQGCSAHRQVARSLGCAPSTVTRQAQRLGRHAMLLHALQLADITQIEEPVVFDHFETFAYSQFDRVAVATSVGKSSGFVYGIEPAPHRRSGKISLYQEKRRARQNVPPPAPGEITRSTRWTLDLLASRVPAGQKLQLFSDGHERYAQALEEHPAAARFVHRIHPNPERGPKGAPRSDEALARDRALFAVDQLHGLWRHSSANHKRETLAFAKRENALMERAYTFALWRNLIKGRSERRGDPTTPAMKKRLTQSPWSWKKALAQRLFPQRVPTLPGMMSLYRRERITPALACNAQHTLVNAF